MDEMKNHNSKTETLPPVSSWAEWFDRCAQHYQDPRMKMAYYKDGATGEPVSMETLQAIHEDVWKKLRPDAQSTLLDVGSGIGLFVQAFQKRLRRIVGTDISFHMMKDAAAINPRGIFLQCDVCSLPFSSKSFDRLLCYSVFHYLPDEIHAQKTIDEFRRVVKNAGSILIGDVLYPLENRSFPNVLIGNPNKEMTGPPTTTNRSPRHEGKAFGGDNSGKNSKKTNKPPHAWWPSCLNHHLKKKTFPPTFFIDYCQKNGLRCEILTQDIKGKDKDERYDVAIRL